MRRSEKPSSKSAGVAHKKDQRLAAESSHQLASYAARPRALRVRIEGSKRELTLPPVAVRLLTQVLAHVGRGDAVSVVSSSAELSTQQAADYLDVSRPFLIARLDAGEIPFRKIGSHRRVRLDDLLRFQRTMYRKRRKSLQRLTALDQEMGLF